MAPTDESRLEVFHDHYKDTFLHLKEYSAQRDRYFLYAAGILTLFHVFSPERAPTVVQAIVNHSVGLDMRFGWGAVATLLWLVLLVVIMKYFRITLTVDLQYQILHRQEDRLCILFGSDVFVRERIGYVSGDDHPYFRKFSALLYNWFFPIILILVAGWRLCRECLSSPTQWLSFGFNALIYLAVLLITFLYLQARNKPTKSAHLEDFGKPRV